MNPAPVHSPRAVACFAADILLLALFAGIGRAAHGEPASGLVTTAAPFWLGLAVGWTATRAWRNPSGLAHPGIGIWISTLVVGMLARVLLHQGVQWSFVVVAGIVTAVFLLGYRLTLSIFTRGQRMKH